MEIMPQLTSYRTMSMTISDRITNGRSIARTVLWALVVAVSSLTASGALAAETAAFGFANVQQIARQLASKPYQAEDDQVPAFLLDMSYDEWRNIRFRTEKSLWRDEHLPFEVQFFHPGLYYDRLVEVNIVEDGQVHPYPYRRDLFDFSQSDVGDKIPDHFGFAGFRLHYPINRQDYKDEVAVFLGASYFRAVGKGQHYGLSARGLAIDTGLDTGEEFPYFKAFWLVKPIAGADALTLYALLDSESLTGAYKFIIEPGLSTRMEISLTLYPRKPVKKLGLVGLTSMYFYGESVNIRPVDDFRPEVHDSDGLLLAYPSGEFVWRPLINDNTLFINAFTMAEIPGFGLLQRDLNFDHYQDLEAYYEKRPSTWVTPVGDWGPGRVELIQIPTDSEKHDNIVAIWVPEIQITPGRPISFSYRQSWFSARKQQQHALGAVAATRTAAGKKENQRKLIVDFKGGRLNDLPSALPADAPLEAIVNVQGEQGRVVEKQLYRNPPGNGWRLVMVVEGKAQSTLEKVLPENGRKAVIEIQAHLRQAGKVVTESWSYAVRF